MEAERNRKNINLLLLWVSSSILHLCRLADFNLELHRSQSIEHNEGVMRGVKHVPGVQSVGRGGGEDRIFSMSILGPFFTCATLLVEK